MLHFLCSFADFFRRLNTLCAVYSSRKLELNDGGISDVTNYSVQNLDKSTNRSGQILFFQIAVTYLNKNYFCSTHQFQLYFAKTERNPE